MSNKNKNDIFTLLAFLLCGWLLISCCFKVLKWIFTLPKSPKHSNMPHTTSWQQYIPECDTKKAIRIEGCLNVICKVFAWFTGVLCIALLISAATIDSNAWKPGAALGVFALLFYFFSKNQLSSHTFDSFVYLNFVSVYNNVHIISTSIQKNNKIMKFTRIFLRIIVYLI